MLACFVALNYVKVVVLDDKLQLLHCFIDERDPNFVQPAFQLSSSVGSGARRLSPVSSGENLCREYLLSYTVFCAYSLTGYLVIILMFSEMYMRRLLGKVLDKEIDLEWKEEEDLEQQEQEDKDDKEDYLPESEEELTEKKSLQNQENDKNLIVGSAFHSVNDGTESLANQNGERFSIVRPEGEKSKDVEWFRSRAVTHGSGVPKDWDTEIKVINPSHHCFFMYIDVHIYRRISIYDTYLHV